MEGEALSALRNFERSDDAWFVYCANTLLSVPTRNQNESLSPIDSQQLFLKAHPRQEQVAVVRRHVLR